MKLHQLAVLSVCVALAAALRVRRDDDDDDDIDLTPTGQTKACKTKDGRDGMCVHESMCTEDHVFQPGGIIDDSEIRIGSCPGKWDWCCVFPNMTTTEPTATDRSKTDTGCRSGTKDSCPWCVGLYRDGGNPRTKSPSGLYCGGAIIGSKIVLTSASCVLGGKGSKLWVQLPGSDKHYTVNSTAKNTQFNSGTREHDTALLLLDEEVPWPEKQTGACLGLKTPLAGDCVAIGFDKKDQLVFTPMSVTSGSCTEQGSSYDAACGHTSGTCSVSSGSPVMCPSDGEGLIVAGLVRQNCVSNAAVLGSLVPSADWIRDELTKNAIAANRYSIIR